jgi:transposase
VDAALRQGARQHGFEAELWTLPRVAKLIERVTGERFHPGHVWKILGALDWSVQKPAQQARERSQQKVEYWVSQRWPEVKKNARQQKAWIYFQDESGFTQQPSVRTTWAPRGQTPILKARGNHWDKTSVAAALGFRWDGQKTRLFARTRKGSFNTASLIDFLKQLKRFVGVAPVILIWDHLPAHRSRDMSQFLWSQRRWLQVEWLPGYAPDLNPTEGVWNNIKGREMANLCPELMTEAARAFRRGLSRVRHTCRLPFSFLRHAGLSF